MAGVRCRAASATRRRAISWGQYTPEGYAKLRLQGRTNTNPECSDVFETAEFRTAAFTQIVKAGSVSADAGEEANGGH